MMGPMRARSLLLLAGAALLAGCGGSSGGNDSTAPVKPRGPANADLRKQIQVASTARPGDFPRVRQGESLQQLADRIAKPGTKAGLATSIFTPGVNRFAFGVLDDKNAFVYRKTAVYVADSPEATARGPYPAPLDVLVTDPPFRSQTAASEKDPFAAVYAAPVPLSKPGSAAVLVVSERPGQPIYTGAPTQIQVKSKAQDKIPAVGERPPTVTTDTVQEAGGDIKSIDTRVPPDDMHSVNFADVVGKKPVALLFATPALCQSRVCGPVVDIAAQLKARYGKRMTFIHQEVYVDNDVNKGLREPLKQFNLDTEPWLFTFDRQGRVAARLEGSFGFNAFERAIRAALN
jgi:hypothetical protein